MTRDLAGYKPHHVVEFNQDGRVWYEVHSGFALVLMRDHVPIRFYGKRGLKRAQKIVDKENAKADRARRTTQRTVYPAVSGNRKEER